MTASRDFGFMLLTGIVTFAIQLNMLKRCTSISFVFSTYTMRNGLYVVLALTRAFTGHGALGRVLSRKR